jgi:hypothetical protein
MGVCAVCAKNSPNILRSIQKYSIENNVRYDLNVIISVFSSVARKLSQHKEEIQNCVLLEKQIIKIKINI